MSVKKSLSLSYAQAAGIDRDPDARAVRRQLNLTIRPDAGTIADAVRSADILVPTVTDVITEELLKQPDCKLKLIAISGNGVDNIDVIAARPRHHRHQYA